MTEGEKAVAYLRYIAERWPSAGFVERNNPTPETIRMGKAIMLTCAEQIEKGQHLRWYEKEGGE